MAQSPNNLFIVVYHVTLSSVQGRDTCGFDLDGTMMLLHSNYTAVVTAIAALQVPWKCLVIRLAVFTIVACAATSVLIFGLVPESQRPVGRLWNKESVVEVAKLEVGQTGHSLSSTEDALDVDILQPDVSAMGYPDNNSTAPKRVALLVFGLQRSLFLTLPSIKGRIIRPLTDVGYEPTVFVHTFEDVGTADKHSKGVTGAWWTELRPFSTNVTSQKQFLDAHRCDTLSVACVWYFAPSTFKSSPESDVILCAYGCDCCCLAWTLPWYLGLTPV